MSHILKGCVLKCSEGALRECSLGIFSLPRAFVYYTVKLNLMFRTLEVVNTGAYHSC